MELILVTLTVGLILFIGGIYKYYRYVNMKEFPYVIGTMDSYENILTYNDNNVKKPIITYTINDVTYRKNGTGNFEFGKRIKVYYDPDNPKNAILENDTGVVSIIVGLLFLILSVIFVLILLGIIK